LVLDVGTSKSKIGYGGDDAPRLISHSYISQNNSMDIEGMEKFVVGDKYLHLDREDR
jgi:actin-related protein